MQKKIIALTLLVGSLFASETPTPEVPPKVESSMGYFEIGLGPFPLPLPAFGLGYRMQNGHHGLDLPLQVSTIVSITQIKGSILYEYYFKPNLKSEFYVGGGLGTSGLFTHKFHKAQLLLSPEFVVGKQYINEAGDTRFMQAQISWPTFAVYTSSHHKKVSHPFWMPLVVFSYGMGF